MIKLILAIILIQISGAFAYTNNSLTWQKLALEEKVQRKFNGALSSVLKDNQYLVEVEVEAADPGSPNFGADDKKSSTRVSDLNLAESRGDYIAFSKVGLEVPVVEKFLDEDRTKLMNLYRFNEAYDLFKNLTGVTVTVYLSDKLPQDLVNIAKKVVSSSRLTVSGIKPSVKYETMAMEWVDPALAKKAEEEEKARKAAELEKEKRQKQQEDKEPKIWAKDWYEWASRWGNAFGLIFGAIIIGAIALALFKQWKSFMEKYAALQAAKNAPEENKEKEEDKESQQIIPGPLTKQEEDMAISQGFDRFKQCLEQHSEDAITIVRSWLNDGEELSLLALRGVAQLASVEEMEKLMNGLSEQQRDKWKTLLGKHLEAHELNIANKHIFQEVIKSFLVPSRIKDGELLNLIMELTPKTTCEFLDKNGEQTGIVMNILSPSVIGKVLAEVDDDTADRWLMEGAEFDLASMDSKVDGLKASLKAFKDSNAPAPFAQRIMAMIPVASPSRESNLYRALARSGSPAMVMEVASNHFPSELVLDLPAPFLKEVLQSYPVYKRVELLYSRPEEVRGNLLDVLAESGTPARDMLDMELENLTRDPSRGAAIESRNEEIWQDFVKTSRSILSKNGAYTNFAEELIKEWSGKLGPGLQAIRGGRAA